MRHDLIFVFTPEYEVAAKRIFSDIEQREVESRLRDNPEVGDLISGTGGVRKLRVGLPGRGRRGGARVLYYYIARDARVYLLSAFAKNESDDVSDIGKLILRKTVNLINQEH